MEMEETTLRRVKMDTWRKFMTVYSIHPMSNFCVLLVAKVKKSTGYQKCGVYH